MNRYKYIDEGRKHIHTLDGNPLIGSTTAKSVIGKGDALMQWYADMAAIAGLAFPVQDIKSEYEKVQIINNKILRAQAKRALDEKYPNYAVARRAAVNHRDEKADEGSERHGELQSYIRNCIDINDGAPLGYSTGDSAGGLAGESTSVSSFIDWSLENVDQFYFTEANCYHEKLWLGGIADLGLKLKDGRRLVGDHKSSKEAYQDQFLQCAMYDLLLNHSGGLDRDGNKLFDWPLADGYVVFPFRSEPFTPEFRWNVEQFRNAVDWTVGLYKLMEHI